MIRILFAVAMLAGLISSAFAQAPSPVPALPDTERRTAYTVSGSTCACAVNFAIYGDGNDVDAWIQVWLNGVRKLSTDPSAGWSLSSVTGSLSSIPRPITNAVLTFNAPQNGTVQIVGARRPRQLLQFQENQSVGARDLNQRFTDITAIERELWDKTNDVTGRGLFFPPGNTSGPMPSPSVCSNAFLTFDASGLNPVCLPPASLQVVNSITAADGSLTITPTTGVVTAKINTANPNIWTGAQTFNAGISLGSHTATSIFGTSGALATIVGPVTPGNCPNFDGAGNIVNGSGPCVSSGSGVTAGTAQQVAYYATTGSVVSGLATVNSSCLKSDSSGNLTWGACGSGLGDVNIVTDCGADPTGTNDSTAAIQQCIDKVALGTSGARSKSIYCPKGLFLTSLPIFLDPPGNLRGADGTNGTAWSSGGSFVAGQTANSAGIAYINLTGTNTATAPASDPTNWRPFAWNSGTTYAQNAIVSYAGVPWKSLINGNLNNVPTATGIPSQGHPATWINTTIVSTNISFSLSLIGDPGIGNGGEPNGCTIQPQNVPPGYNDVGAQRVGIWVGTGQGMMVKDINVIYAGSGSTGLQNPLGVGISIAGGSGGAQRTLISGVWVSNVYTAFATGLNQDGLGAETTWFKTVAQNCEIGIQLNGTQNFINDVTDTSMNCVRDFITVLGPSFNIKGGNQSATFGWQNSFAISGVSALTFDAGTGTYNFSATVNPAGDINITRCWNAAGTNIGGTDALGNCIYDAWSLLLPGFGPAPFTMTSWNPSTNVGQFRLLKNWANYIFPDPFGNNGTLFTDISAEVQAQTTIYATQRLIVYTGVGGSIEDIHLENNGGCTTLLQSFPGSGGDAGVLLQRIRINGSMADSSTPARRYCQLGFPFIDNETAQTNVTLSGNNELNQQTDPFVFDLGTGVRFYAEGNMGAFWNPFTRIVFNDNSGHGDDLLANGSVPYTRAQGAGDWENCPFAPLFSYNPTIARSGPCLGYRAAPWTTPRISLLDWSIVSTTLPAALQNYLPIDGSTIYSKLDAIDNGSGLPQQARLVQSSHAFYSYGQNLTTTNISGLSLKWIGKGTAVMADANTLQYVWPGLAVYLDSGSGPVRHIVTGVVQTLSLDGGTHPGYFTVVGASTINGPYTLTGTSGTTYTSTHMNQDPYSWGALSTFQSISPPVASACGTSPSVGANSTNQSGSFTTGTGTPTACTLTFALAYPTSAFCSISPANAAANGVSGGTYISAQSKTAFTVTLGTGTNSAQYNYTCQGS